MDYITKIGNKWYAQLAVPADVAGAIGTKLFRKSLRTGDMREAKKLAGVVVAGWQSQIDHARGKPVNPALRDAIEALRTMGYVVAAPDDPIEDWAQDDEGIPVPPVPPTAEAVADFAKIAADLEGRAAAVTAKHYAAKAVAAGLPVVAAEAAGVAAKLSGEREPSPSCPTLSGAVGRWKQERAPSRSAQYDAGFALRVFTELFGDLRLADIKRAHMAELLDILKRYPTRIPVADKSLPVERLVAKYADKPEHKPEAITAVKKWRLIDAALGVAVHLGQLEANPADGIKPSMENSKKAKVKPRLPFSDEQLKAIWRKLATENEEHRWFHVLGLATGARLNEICQLRSADVIERDGVVCVNLTNEPDEHGGKLIKNASSVRTVPLRSEIAAPFKAFARSRNGLLFPGWQSVDGTSNKASKRLGCVIKPVTKDKRYVFHSYRHRFEDACRAAGVAKDIRGALTGHADSDVSASYGNGFPVSVLSEAVERLAFPVDLAFPTSKVV